MVEIEFSKGHGTGNDFVLLLDRDGELEITPALVRELCDRHFGIGADGLIRAVSTSAMSRLAGGASATGDVGPARASEALESEPNAEWFMDYRNADGSLGEMCGNGVRVFVRYLLSRQLATLETGRSLAIATRAGVKDVQAAATGFAVDLGRWRLEAEEVLVRALHLKVARPGLGINVGNPHVVVALASAEELEALNLSEAPQLEPAPADGANVEFVVPADPLVVDGVGRLSMRVYERGVGETLSCGTGIAAAALATRYWAGREAPSQWQVTVPGGQVAVRMFATEDGEHVAISGPAELSYAGRFSLD